MAWKGRNLEVGEVEQNYFRPDFTTILTFLSFWLVCLSFTCMAWKYMLLGIVPCHITLFRRLLHLMGGEWFSALPQWCGTFQLRNLLPIGYCGIINPDRVFSKQNVSCVFLEFYCATFFSRTADQPIFYRLFWWMIFNGQPPQNVG